MQREGEYFPKPPSGWDRFKDIGGTILKGAAVIAVRLAVAAAVLAVCSTGIGCVLLIGAAAGVAAGATAGGLFCGATLECIGKGALAGGVAGLAAAAAGLGAAALGAGALTTMVIGGGAAGFAGNLTDQLLGGGPIDPKSLAISTGVGMISAGLLAKAAPGLVSRLQMGGSRTTWVPPKDLRLPAASKGTWRGTPGNSEWTPRDPGRLGLKPGQRVPFHEGTPNFKQHAHRTPSGKPGTFEVSGLTGNPKGDYRAALSKLAEQEGMTQKAVAKWLTENKLTIHHYKGSELQLVPSDLHGGLAHQGSASALRNMIH